MERDNIIASYRRYRLRTATHWLSVAGTARIGEARERFLSKSAWLIEDLYPLGQSFRTQTIDVFNAKGWRLDDAAEQRECLVDLVAQHSEACHRAVPVCSDLERRPELFKLQCQARAVYFRRPVAKRLSGDLGKSLFA
jgi:hypothetical protein